MYQSRRTTCGGSERNFSEPRTCSKAERLRWTGIVIMTPTNDDSGASNVFVIQFDVVQSPDGVLRKGELTVSKELGVFCCRIGVAFCKQNKFHKNTDAFQMQWMHTLEPS